MAIIRNLFSSLQVVVLRASAPSWLFAWGCLALPTGQLTNWQLAPWSRQVRGQDIPELCCILFIRSESLNRPHIQGEGIKQRCEYQERDHGKPYQHLLPMLNRVSVQKIPGLFSLDSPLLLVLWKAKEVNPGPQWNTFGWHFLCSCPQQQVVCAPSSSNTYETHLHPPLPYL